MSGEGEEGTAKTRNTRRTTRSGTPHRRGDSDRGERGQGWGGGCTEYRSMEETKKRNKYGGGGWRDTPKARYSQKGGMVKVDRPVPVDELNNSDREFNDVIY